MDSSQTVGKHARPPEPWTFLLYRRSPLRTSLTGVALGLATLLLYMLLESLSGRPQAVLRGTSPADVGCEYLLGDYRIGVVGMILLAYSTSARFKLAQWTRQTLDELGSGSMLEAEGLAQSRPWGFLPGFAGLVISFSFAIDIAERDIEWTNAYWIFPHIFNWAWTLPFGWVAGRLIYAVIADAIIVSRVARSIEVNDLAETRSIDAAVKHGLRTSFVSLMFLGIVSVHFIDPGLNASSTVFLVVLYLVGAALSTLPTLGVMQSYYDRRDAELELLRSEIAVEEQQLLDKDPDYEPGRIGDLVSMEKRLTDYKVAVFRFSTVTKLALYALIGFLSWLGAAAVSVVVENMFGF